MKNNIKNTLIACSFLALFSCQSDDMDVLIPQTGDITLNELTLDKEFTHAVPANGFTSKGIHFNTVRGANGQLEAGFAYSNRSNRSFTWTNSEAALDTNRYSVFTKNPNRTETYAVAKVRNDETFFTLDKPSVIEHILVANTTYTYLAVFYGDSLGTAAAPVVNPKIPSAPLGVWYSYVPGGVKKLVKADKDYFRIIAIGYNNSAPTDTIQFDLACLGSNPEHLNWEYFVDDWYKFDLTELGLVDKVVFDLESSDVDANGNMRTPAWFCIDGIRLKQ
ncbi:MAG: DUF4465 domain-containing protein [Tannerella sp.]|jgi:hypothetical protein|nr:DUF4465 domain-containing protein [Tannerella sp.]